ncbi:MAG: S-adenosyl-l-methionine hydroxide adenosyltransferase family protein [Thermodesulfobacteriota bacterium]
MRSSVITLLTDFGTRDHYVASMKGTILKINPEAKLVDITHHVSPYDVREGAFLLANAYSAFPRGTIHLSVVDPGVGGPRKPILIVTANYSFVGPDNGIFASALKREKVKKAVVLKNPKYLLSDLSDTFHGRDVFAPVAAHLSLGVKPEAFGPVLNSWIEFDFEEPRMKEGRLIGEIIHIDAFGNLMSGIDEKRLFDFVKDRSFEIKIGKRAIRGLKKGYWEGKRNELLALIGSGGFLEISLREGNAQKKLKVKRGDSIQISTKFQIH